MIIRIIAVIIINVDVRALYYITREFIEFFDENGILDRGKELNEKFILYSMEHQFLFPSAGNVRFPRILYVL